ncbi:hypothetical protein ACQEVM_36815 [Streptomyces sp. CA-243310]|uniref:hypothetical protein n=1 Tax=Streptomyces sp. CA-243310 TaxID=3240056 RepID=UPI003D913BC0
MRRVHGSTGLLAYPVAFQNDPGLQLRYVKAAARAVAGTAPVTRGRAVGTSGGARRLPAVAVAVRGVTGVSRGVGAAFAGGVRATISA